MPSAVLGATLSRFPPIRSATVREQADRLVPKVGPPTVAAPIHDRLSRNRPVPNSFAENGTAGIGRARALLHARSLRSAAARTRTALCATALTVVAFSTGCGGPDPFFVAPERVLPKAIHSDPWVPVGEPRVHEPNDLEEYIDGAARPYLEYGFVQLIHGVYARKDNANRKMVVDVYEMTSPVAAYGIYSIQRPDKAEEVRLGTVGYWSEGHLGFVKDRIYVSIQPPGETVGDMAAAMLIGGYVDGRIALPAVPPAELGAFPSQDLVANSQKYLAKNMLGHEFLGAGWQATYMYRGVTHILFFMVNRTPTEALQRYERLADFVGGKGGRIVRQVSGIGRAALVGAGESTGRIFVACGGPYLVGTVDCFDDDRSITLSRTLLENLHRLKVE